MTRKIPSGLVGLTLAGILTMPPPLHAQSSSTPPRPDTTVTLGTVTVTATTASEDHVTVLQRLTLPATVGIAASKIEQTVNIVDAEDAVKYMPSLFVRKRNYGDTQATLASRVWGVSSSARSLIFADDVPITALIANNNTLGGPRWGMISPEEIARIDVMYGPYSAAYSGNSMGAVMAITTRQPDHLEATVEQTQALQDFSLYGTHRLLPTSQTNAVVGNRFGRLSFWLSGNFQSSSSQPLTYVTSADPPDGTTGGYASANKFGAPLTVLGASGLLDARMANAKAKVAWDITPATRATYTGGLWTNDASAGVDPYIARNGAPSYGGVDAFANGNYDLVQRHTSHALSLRTATRRDWDFEVVGAVYRMLEDRQRFPAAVSGETAFADAGRIAVLDGTGWVTGDVKAAWHRGGLGGRHVVSFGAHGEHYRLTNPTYDTPDWHRGEPTTVQSAGNGKTETFALWAQDAWRTSATSRLTLGARYERWRAFDGYNAKGGTAVNQPEVRAARLSPKLSFNWLPGMWQVTASVAKAYRFATPAELYQLVTTGASFTAPDPNLKPDDVLSAELRLSRMLSRGTIQVSLFQDDVHDAIIAQFLPLVPDSPTLYSYLSNVDHVRARGVEVAATGDDLLVRGLGLSGNVTWLDARTLAMTGRASATAPEGAAIGRFLPNIPKWRAGFSATYQPRQPLTLTLGGRYSSKLYTTLDNADVRFDTYQAFGDWFVMDAKASYAWSRQWSSSIGVDNLLDRKYFLFHPFPHRTLVASARFRL